MAVAVKARAGVPGSHLPKMSSARLSSCGIFIYSGITERFGADIFDRLEKEGEVQIVWPNRNNPDVDPLKRFTWTLTKEVIHSLAPAGVHRSECLI